MSDFFHFYVRRRQAIIPTVARTEEGFFLDVEPVALVDLGDVHAVKKVLLEALSADNPVIATPDQAVEPKSVVLKKLNLRRWDAFERESILYTIHRGAESITVHVTGRGKDGMWREASENKITFALVSPLEEIVDIVVGDVLVRKETLEGKPATALLLPPPKPD